MLHKKPNRESFNQNVRPVLDAAEIKKQAQKKLLIISIRFQKKFLRSYLMMQNDHICSIPLYTFLNRDFDG